MQEGQLALVVALLFPHSGAPSPAAGDCSLSFPSDVWLPGECSLRPLFPSKGISVVCSDRGLAPVRESVASRGLSAWGAREATWGCAVATGGPQTQARCRCPLPPDSRDGLGGGWPCGAGRSELRFLPHCSVCVWRCGSAQCPGSGGLGARPGSAAH